MAIEKRNQWGKVLLLGKHSDVNEEKMKENIYLEKLWTAMILYRCLLLTSDLLEPVEKLSKHVVEGICPSKRTILKNYSMFYSEIENNVLPLRNVSVSYALQCTLSHRFFCWFNKQVQNLKMVYRNVLLCVTLVTRR